MRTFYYWIFLLSGFSGLIYESIWSHYLKLLLGHAAYAQTLVLAIFMGGMALGSWGAARFSQKASRPLMLYALVEGVIGVFGLLFHPLFVSVSGALLDQWLPQLSDPALATALKWGIGALLILPQSILLGATFPLMSAGLLRAFPDTAGRTLSNLYFANSLGAVFGVLASGFLLVGLVGLPGTIFTAALLNIILALVVWLPAREQRDPVAIRAADATTDAGLDRWLLVAAAVTGAASFCYEIGWIRMLSMVLGSSTHSFELMLAAFILGLALGGLYIRRRIDTIANPGRFLGWIQLAMASLALLSLPLYGRMFDLMAWALRALARSDESYTSYVVLSHAIALVIMLPATFCAGMTLPLITLILFRQQRGERAIGQVYSANTVGAIIAILIAVHVLMPLTGLKGLMVAGALLDGVLGLFLLLRASDALTAPQRRGGLLAGAGFAGLVLAVGAGMQLDLRKMGGGVYRSGKSSLDADVGVPFWRDGKTASISLMTTEGSVYLATNGKTDAAINMTPGGKPEADEVTMTLAGIIPSLYRPDARTVANIGMGSGLTTHALLSSPVIQRVDTIEIEQAIVDAARQGFAARVGRTFTDPRSIIHIDDAKTFFSSTGRRYDVIVSEPSNPWVSGVASLFSDEFYHHVTRYLNDDGLFVQWIQGYETGTPIIASVVKALSPHFKDYVIYNTDNANILVLASKRGPVGELQSRLLQAPAVRAELKRVGIDNLDDIEIRKLGNRAVLQPLFAQEPSPANSDYFPYIDQHAVQHRFKGSNALELMELAWQPLPVLEMLRVRTMPQPGLSIGDDPYNDGMRARRDATALARAIQSGDYTGLSLPVRGNLSVLTDPRNCAFTRDLQVNGLVDIASRLTPYLPAAEVASVWQRLGLRASPCWRGETSLVWLDLVEAAARRDAQAMNLASTRLLAQPDPVLDGPALAYAVSSALLARTVLQDAAGKEQLVKEVVIPLVQQHRLKPSLPLRMLVNL